CCSRTTGCCKRGFMGIGLLTASPVAMVTDGRDLPVAPESTAAAVALLPIQQPTTYSAATPRKPCFAGIGQPAGGLRQQGGGAHTVSGHCQRSTFQHVAKHAADHNDDGLSVWNRTYRRGSS